MNLDSVEIGMFRKTHALKGELNATFDIDLNIENMSDAFKWLIVEIEGLPVPFEVESIRKKGLSSALIKLKNIDSAADAELFVNKTFSLPEKIYTELSNNLEDYIEDADGIFMSDLEGFSIIDDESKHLIGIIENYLDSQLNPLFEITTPEGEQILVPATEDLIIELNVQEKLLTMSLPSGLLDLNKTKK